MVNVASHDGPSLVAMVDDLQQLLKTRSDATDFDRGLVSAISQLAETLRAVVADNERLAEEQRGWTRREMSIDHPGAAQDPVEGENDTRSWNRTSMSIDPGSE